MKLKRAIFVSGVVLLCFVCLSVMNVHYDRLSRYPYQDQESRKLIDKYLDDSEIEYIIEYSIAPSTFIKWIKAPNFNIYHAAEYAFLDESFSYLSYLPSEIVNMVEQTRELITVEDLALLMEHYTFGEVKLWLDNGDPYYSHSQLVLDPSALDTVVDDDHTIATHRPFTLREPNGIPVLKTDETGKDIYIQVDQRLIEPLQNLCLAAQDEVSSRECGGLILTSGFVSYDEQQRIFKDAKQEYGSSVILYADYPGHSEHQLGLAVDFALTGKTAADFSTTRQSEWLQENAWRFGFIQTYTEDKVTVTNKLARPQHYRYVGTALAAELHESGKTLKEVRP